MGDRFYKLPQDVTARKDLQPSDKLVFAVILDSFGNDERCWPGIRTLAKRTGLSDVTVVECVKRLESAGVLEVERRGNGKSNYYHIPKSVKETLTVEKHKRLRNLNGGAKETLTEAFKNLKPNQTDSLNQTYGGAFSFCLRGNGDLWHLTQAKLNEYIQAFPRLDVEAELRKAAQWLNDNPSRRKTAKGMTRFLGGWLGRATPKPEPKRGDIDWLPTDEEAEALMRDVGYG